MLPLNPKALWALSSVLLGGALLVSGCGGGGGGVSTPTSTPGPTPTITPIPTATPAGTLFVDEFNGPSLDTSKWTVLGRDRTIQRTELGNQPTFGRDNDGTSYMSVNLNSYLPNNTNPALQFYGTEVAANTLIPRGNGVVFEARMRMANSNQAGMVGSFFLFGQKGTYGSATTPLSFDEIDHELLTTAYAATSPYTWTNAYNDFRVPQPGLPSGDDYGNPLKNLGKQADYTPGTGYNPAGWNVYRIEWKAGQVQWFINNNPTPIRTETSVIVPDDPLGVRFNLWAAAAAPIGWDAAYSSTLVPATTASANQTYRMDVDWVNVNTLGTTGTTGLRSLSTIPLSPAQIQHGAAGSGYVSTKRR